MNLNYCFATVIFYHFINMGILALTCEFLAQALGIQDKESETQLTVSAGTRTFAH